MSGLVYHVVCSTCGRTSPTLDLARDRTGVLALPGANHTTHELDAVEIAEPGEAQVLARERSTTERPVAAVVVRGEDLILVPPLPCPADGTPIERAVWGSAPPRRGALASLDEIIAATRAATSELEFTSPDNRYDVIVTRASRTAFTSWRGVSSSAATTTRIAAPSYERSSPTSRRA